jgi:hypothetical protein
VEKQKEQLANLSQEIAKAKISDSLDLSKSNTALLIDALTTEGGQKVAGLLAQVTANPQGDMNTQIGQILSGEATDEEVRAISDNLQQSKSQKEQEIGQRKLQVLREKIDRLPFPEGFTLRHFEAADFNQEFSALLAQELNIVDPNALAPLLGSEVGQEAMRRKFQEYEKQHDQAMEKEFSRELQEKMASAPISPEMAIQHLEGEEFEQAYFDELLKNASPELLEELEEHADLRGKLFRNESVNSGLKQKYREYQEAHDKAMEEKFSAELEDLINAGELTDDFSLVHREEDGFSSEYFELMLRDASPELLEELGEHQGLKEKLFGTAKVKNAVGEKFKNYEREHERMMENTFSKELEELIADISIPADMASLHLEDDEFQELFFARTLEKASPELRQELEEHAELQETLFSHRGVSAALATKSIDYEKAHEEAMKKKFTAEITEKMKARRISPKFAEKHRDEEDFQDDFFQEILAEASPELREELGEHDDLEETLFEQAEVEATLEKKFLDYEKAHDASMEAKFSQELEERIPAAKISEKMAAQHFEKKEFSTAFFAKVLQGASPELKAELGEHQDLRQKLFDHKGVQAALEKQFEGYEHLREKEKRKVELEEKKQKLKEEKEKEKEKMKKEKEEEKSKKERLESLEKEIPNRLRLSEEDIAEENYHQEEQGGFAAFRIEMNERIADLLPEDTDLREALQTIGGREIVKQYAAWKQGHEMLHSAEMQSARREIETALVLTQEDYEEESFHEPRVLKTSLQNRLSVVFAATPDDLHAGLRGFTREKIAATEAQWRRRHELHESQEMKEAKKQLTELFVLGDADKEDETLHNRGRFTATMVSRLEPVLSLLPTDLQEALQPWLRAETGKLHAVWTVAHETHEKSLIEKAEKNITEKLELHPDDRENELFHKERAFRTAMRSRIIGVLRDLPADLKEEIQTMAEAKISDSYHQWTEAHEREHEQNLSMANTKFDHIIESSRQKGDQTACSDDILDRAEEVIEDLPEDLRAEARENLAEKMSTFFRSWKKTEADAAEKKSPWVKSADFGRFSAKDLERGHERLDALTMLPSMKALLKQRERFFMPFLLMATIVLSESEFGNLKRSLQRKTLDPAETLQLIFNDPSRLRKTMLMKEHSPQVWKGFQQGLEKMKLPFGDLLEQEPEDDEEALIEAETALEQTEEDLEVPIDLSQEIHQKSDLDKEAVEENDDQALSDQDREMNEEEHEEQEEKEDGENANQEQESKEKTEKKQGVIPKTPDYKEIAKAKPSPVLPERPQEKVTPVLIQKKTPTMSTRVEEKTADIIKQVPSTEQPRAIKEVNDLKPSPEKRIPDKMTEPQKVMTQKTQEEKTLIRIPTKETLSESLKIIIQKEKIEEKKTRLVQIEPTVPKKNFNEKEELYQLNEFEDVPFMFHADVQRDEQMARYLESILLEKENHSITLKFILQAFIQYARLSSGLTIPYTIHISPEILNLTVLDPEKLFSDLAKHYHGCCEQHAESSHFLFRSWQINSSQSMIDVRIAFDIEQLEINEVCAAFIDCRLEKTRELSLS